MEYFIALFIAHLLGDFFLQSDDDIKNKQDKGFRSSALYKHGLIHGVLSFIALIATYQVLQPQQAISIGTISLLVLAIAISHIIIDLAKREAGLRSCQQNITGLFILDQIAHVLVLLIAVSFLGEIEFNGIEATNIKKGLVHICVLLLMTKPISILIQMIFRDLKITPSFSAENDNAADENQRVGQTIGYIERFIIYFAVLANQWPAIGFLVAAKSIFRFGDLNNPDNRNKAEMILLGTLLSFGIGVIISQAAQWWINTYIG